MKQIQADIRATGLRVRRDDEVAPSSLESRGGDLTKFCTGRLRPEVQPLTLSYTILAEKVPLSHTYFRKSCSSFHVVLNK